MGNGWFTKYVCGRLPASLGSVEVGVEADQNQVVLLSRDVLMASSKSKPKRRADSATAAMQEGTTLPPLDALVL